LETEESVVCVCVSTHYGGLSIYSVQRSALLLCLNKFSHCLCVGGLFDVVHGEPVHGLICRPLPMQARYSHCTPLALEPTPQGHAENIHLQFFSCLCFHRSPRYQLLLGGQDISILRGFRGNEWKSIYCCSTVIYFIPEEGPWE
jgi:hypothetical protein